MKRRCAVPKRRRPHDELTRRSLLRRSVAGAALVSAGPITAGAAESKLGGCAEMFGPPSNALVTGVDPEELVLFAFDDHSIPLRSKINLTLTQPELHENNPVLRRGLPGELDHLFAAMYGTVFFLDGKFRMWYGAVDTWEGFEPSRGNIRLAYAESTDGIHWEKPKLGLREFAGDKDNNLLDLKTISYNPLVLYDPDESDASKRFKIAYTGYRHPEADNSNMAMIRVAYSPDGLRWTDEPATPAVRNFWTEVSGMYRWNGVYYVNGQSSYPPSNPKRAMISFASPDLVHWEQAAIVSFYRPEKQEGFHVGRQVHLGAAIWHRRNVLLGLYGAWEGPPTNRRPDVRMNLGLIISNDGLLFREPEPDFAFIRWGTEPSGWKTFRLLQGSAFVNHGDKTYIWYGAGIGEHEAIENQCEVGLATLPRDRFGCLTPQKPDAFWTSHTLPPIPGGARLAVNVDGIDDDAHLEIDILDPSLKPVADYSGGKAAVVKNSGLRESVIWAGGESIPTERPWRIRARFVGASATDIRFYCLYIRPA